MRIEIIGGLDGVDPDDGNADVLVHLDDGRVFSFVVATPRNLYWCMQNEGTDYFLGVPPLIVKALSADSISRAIGALMSDGGRWLNVYGTPQV